MKNLVKKLPFEAHAMLALMGLLAVMLFLGGVQDAYAFDNLLDPETDVPEQVPENDFRVAVVNFLFFILTFLGLIAIAFIIYAGFLFIVAGGDEEQVGKAKKIILYAGLGIIVILFSYAIVEFFISIGLGAGGGDV